MNRLPIVIVLAFLVVLYLTGCTDEDLARSERVVRAGMDAYYHQPAYTGYAQQPLVLP